ncbi:hypothetical protein SISNIDRAFT_490418 [Sistotremastrum niveocremeum HHB9708]|uniref:Uncharacterized protein n=1 Tax=Sistotremastrum niveocremeum HHB9708 TaxID=1314777 RepID=A0A164NUW2_9AGAM|nr:hypothetical protein SISNIDRAFT_490418 [Sistotremastrum niveocremeum HHB9708]
MSSSSFSNGVLEKLEIAKTKKDAGDAAFKSGDVKAGLARSNIPGMGPPPEDPATAPKTEADEILEKVYSNMAACHIKSGNWKRAVESADKALKKNENNSKALFRKAKAQAELGYTEKAEKILETLARKSPADAPACNAELKRIRAIDAEREKKHNQKMKGFLSRDPKRLAPEDETKPATNGSQKHENDEAEVKPAPLLPSGIEEVPADDP